MVENARSHFLEKWQFPKPAEKLAACRKRRHAYQELSGPGALFSAAPQHRHLPGSTRPRWPAIVQAIINGRCAENSTEGYKPIFHTTRSGVGGSHTLSLDSSTSFGGACFMPSGGTCHPWLGVCAFPPPLAQGRVIFNFNDRTYAWQLCFVALPSCPSLCMHLFSFTHPTHHRRPPSRKCVNCGYHGLPSGNPTHNGLHTMELEFLLMYARP